jgi:hypothetical protein
VDEDFMAFWVHRRNRALAGLWKGRP